MSQDIKLETRRSYPSMDHAARISIVGHPRWTLTYHEVEPERSNYIYAVTLQQLEEQLKLVAERNKRRPASYITQITFDDGHDSNFEIATPVLERHALKAMFFVTVCRIGTHPRSMSWGQLRALTDAGHSVQSHGWSHKFLVHCSPAQLRDELGRSKAELEQRSGLPVHSLSLPGGRWNNRVLRAAAEIGYRRVYTSEFWQEATVREGVLVAGRFMVRNDTSIAQMQKWFSTDIRSLRAMRAKNSAQNAIRRVVGDRLYHKVWCWLAVSTPSRAKKKSEQVSFHQTQ